LGGGGRGVEVAGRMFVVERAWRAGKREMSVWVLLHTIALGW
jgi:hypothetical protein